MRVNITFPPRSQPANLRTLKRWQDLSGLDAQRYNANGVDQFGYYSPYITDAAGNWVGDWSANNLWSYLTHADMLKIRDMQVTDEFTPEQKMAYLCSWGDGWGSPMRVPGSLPWDTAPLVKMIAAYYAGQQVEVLETKELLVDYMGGRKYTPMSRVRSFARADFGVNKPGLVHTMTGVSVNNTYRERVKGLVRLPVALGADFQFAGGFQPAQWWLMDSWLA